jgi:hypothetical protein
VTPLDVTEQEATADRRWFSENPQRRYRIRWTDGFEWLVRRRGTVLLRTIAVGGLPRGVPDADNALRPVWFGAALPQLTAAERAELTKLAKRGER